MSFGKFREPVGQKISRLIRERGISPETLSTRAGVELEVIRKIEDEGQSALNILDAAKICFVLEISIDDLFYDTSEYELSWSEKIQLIRLAAPMPEENKYVDRDMEIIETLKELELVFEVSSKDAEKYERFQLATTGRDEATKALIDLAGMIVRARRK